MPNRPPRDPSTRDLLTDMNRRRRRRRQLQLAAAVTLGAALLTAFLAAVLIVRHERQRVLSVGAVETTVPFPVTTQAASTTSTTLPLTSTTRFSATPPPTTTPRTTAAPVTTRPSASTTLPPSNRFTVVIDPGHQAQGDNALEPIGPGAAERKPKVTSGTSGVVTGQKESEFNLNVALKLRDRLTAAGIKVVMIRTTQDVNIANSARAQTANSQDADLFIRIHADGSENRSIRGIHVLYPATVAGWTDDIATPSKRAAQVVQKAVIAATGAADRGVTARSDMTGFNWSDVPTIIPELGFMSNAEEDRLLATDAYRAKIALGLSQGIVQYLQGG